MNTDKSKITAYILWLLIGAFGAHRFYLGRVKTGVLMAVLLVGSLSLNVVGYNLLFQAIEDETYVAQFGQWNVPWLLITGVGSILMIVWVIWYLLDLYFIHAMMKKDRRAAPMTDTQAASVFK